MKLESSLTSKIRARFGKRGKLPSQLIHPVREWETSLFVVVLVAASLFAYAGVDFYTQYTDSNRPEVSEESIPRYRESDALSLIRTYEGKAGAFQNLRDDRPIIIERTGDVVVANAATSSAPVAEDAVAE